MNCNSPTGSLIRTSQMIFVMSVVVLTCCTTCLSATPVDLYQDMESGQNGDVLMPSIMNASNHGTGSWSVPSGRMWVGDRFVKDLPGPVTLGGKTYSGAGSTRTWKLEDKLTNHYVSCRLPGNYSTVTTACFFTAGLKTYCYTNDDTIRFVGEGWGVMQMQNPDNKGPYLIGHACLGGNSGSRDSIKIVSRKAYWINLHYDGVVGKCFLAVFDPDKGFAQVGSTVEAPAILGTTVSAVQFGRCDNHGDDKLNDTQSYFGQILVDYTHGTFPLLPSGSNDSTPPSAPAAVRDGMGAGQALALSAKELSANWDAATDTESGIQGYQYSIGTTPGGTQVVDWTSINNVLGVTSAGLSLTTGQTYYFNVRAVNGVGLVSPARSSRGQAVGIDTTPPSAPAAVRDGGMYGTMGQDCDQTSVAADLACNFDPATDPESGIRGYEYAVGTARGAADVTDWTPLASNAYLMYVRPQGLQLKPGQRYYFSVRAINNAGLTGLAASSDGQTLVDLNDTTPPSAPAVVRDGTSVDIEATTSTTQLSANWDTCSDPESGIQGYQYAIGTAPGSTDVLNWTKVPYTGPVTSVTKAGLRLSVGKTYYFSVKAVNGKGLVGSITTSKGQRVVSDGN